MDFELTDEQRDIQKAVSDFAKGEFSSEIAQDLDRKEEFPWQIYRKACELGFMGVHFDEKFGGQGLGVLENVLIVEELCRNDSSLGVALSLSDFASEIILRHGTEEQKEGCLKSITQGKALSAGCFTEPDHGSDITMMATHAIKDGNEYIINGTKTLITNGTIASYYTVLCQTNPEATPSYRGQSLIIIEKDCEGVDATKIGNKMGIRMSPTAEVSFTNVRVPLTNLIGEENRGFYYAMEFFDESRIEIASQALGIAQGAFDKALSYAKERQQFGRRIADFQVIQHKFADMAIKIETARLLIYKAASGFDKGKIDPVLTSMAKTYAGRIAVEVCDEAVQIFGGWGFIGEYDVERFYRDAKVTELYEGTREIQKNTIASFLLGKKA